MARRHFPRVDGSLCPDSAHCRHTTDFDGETCECCGQTIEAEPVKAAGTDQDQEDE